jgi:lipoic acid synthetase
MKRLPVWLRRRHSLSELHEIKGVLRSHGLSTVCEEARCPNKSECFSKPTATFMILGDRCARDCGFCSVRSAPPLPPDPDEPRRVALAAKRIALKYVVVTSVTRDDLPDGGAAHFAQTIAEIKNQLPCAGVEVLTPDFGGQKAATETVLAAGPDVFNHNVETVPRLYPTVRPRADYGRSIRFLRLAKELSPETRTKSGLMLGLGETVEEVLDVLRDLRAAGCDLLTIGQYLRPAKENLPVVKYVEPEIFERLREDALEMGFTFVASGPFVRSSMNAEEMYKGNVSV